MLKLVSDQSFHGHVGEFATRVTTTELHERDLVDWNMMQQTRFTGIDEAIPEGERERERVPDEIKVSCIALGAQ